MSQTKKRVDEVDIPVSLSYYAEHTWVARDGEHCRIGITDFAQDQLGEIIFIELPEVGTSYRKGKAFGCAESTKSVSSLYMPISGEIVQVHTAVSDNPELVNQDAYGEGWMILVKPTNPAELQELLSADSYRRQLSSD